MSAPTSSAVRPRWMIWKFQWTRRALYMISYLMGFFFAAFVSSVDDSWIAATVLGLYGLAYAFFCLTPPEHMEKSAQEASDEWNQRWENAYQLGKEHGASEQRLANVFKESHTPRVILTDGSSMRNLQ